MVPPKCAPFELFNYSSLSNYIVLAFSSAVTSLWNKSSMTFKDRLLNSMTFKAWKMKYLNSMTFQVLHDLYEPCSTYASKHRPLLIHQKATAITLLLSTWATVKQKANRNTSNIFFWDDAFPPIKRVTRKSQKAKEMHKKVCCTCKLFLLLLLFFFLLIRYIDFSFCLSKL